MVWRIVERPETSLLPYSVTRSYWTVLWWILWHSALAKVWCKLGVSFLSQPSSVYVTCMKQVMVAIQYPWLIIHIMVPLPLVYFIRLHLPSWNSFYNIPTVLEVVGKSWRTAVTMIIGVFYAIGYFFLATTAMFVREWQSLSLIVSLTALIVLIPLP